LKREKVLTQKEALDILKLGYNVFLTGSAGSGKTFVLNQYVDYLKVKYAPIAVTASTGIAATHIHGITVHSWSGIQIALNLTENEITNLIEKPYLQKNFEAKVLIIDEISMLGAQRLDLIDRVCKAFKRNQLPFGGMQVVFCGDFFQLPPVSKDEENPAQFAYKASSWEEAKPIVCYLGGQYRQKDKKFLQILNDIRKDNVGEIVVSGIRSRLNAPIENNSTATKLFTRNEEIDTINHSELALLPGKENKYQMQKMGSNKYLIQQLCDNCLAPEILKLKKRAIVMFVKNNFNKGYVNGTLGLVTDFDSDGFPVVRVNSGKSIIAIPESWPYAPNGKVIAEIKQVPLRLAWAITIHKSQGMSLDAAEIDLSNVFEEGMGYVALSRVRSLKAIKLLGISDLAYKVNTEVLNFDKELNEKSLLAKVELKRLGRKQKIKLQKEYISRLLKK
jgi:ATP-dependent exoDNAse (exonuclease V) alpha subunit